jgi:hypothetical protein
MSVDLTFKIGVGAVIPQSSYPVIYELIPESDDDFEWVVEKWLKANYPALDITTVGSYYESGPEAVQRILTVKALTTSYDAYDVPSGLLGRSADRDLTDDEWDQFGNASRELIGHPLIPEPFVGTLWH